MNFQQLLLARRGAEWKPPERLLALDPGETTGVALFLRAQLSLADHCDTKEDAFAKIARLLHTQQPTLIVCEDYLVYGHKATDHSWSQLHTPKLIGGIAMWAHLHSVPLVFQNAATAKPFCSPEKLMNWGLWPTGQRHAADAIKHGCYYLLFGKEV